MISADELRQIAQGQAERNVNVKTMNCYFGKVRMMMEQFDGMPDVRYSALMLDPDGKALYHIGTASNIRKLQYPLTSDNARLLFAKFNWCTWIGDDIERNKNF